MDLKEVREIEAQIISLEEERDGYRKEAKRCKEDISALILARRRRLMNPNQMEIDAPPKATVKH